MSGSISKPRAPAVTCWRPAGVQMAMLPSTESSSRSSRIRRRGSPFLSVVVRGRIGFRAGAASSSSMGGSMFRVARGVRRMPVEASSSAASGSTAGSGARGSAPSGCVGSITAFARASKSLCAICFRSSISTASCVRQARRANRRIRKERAGFGIDYRSAGNWRLASQFLPSASLLRGPVRWSRSRFGGWRPSRPSENRCAPSSVM